MCFSFGKGVKPSAVICLHRISDNRVARSTLKNFRTFSKLCDDENIVFVTTMWDGVERDVAEERQIALKNMLAGSQIHRFCDTPTSAWTIIDEAVSGNQQIPLLPDELRALAGHLGNTLSEVGIQTAYSEDSHDSAWTTTVKSVSEKEESPLLPKEELVMFLESLITKWESMFRKLRDAVRRGYTQLARRLATHLEFLRQRIVTVFETLGKMKVPFGAHLRMIFTFCKQDTVSAVFPKS